MDDGHLHRILEGATSVNLSKIAARWAHYGRWSDDGLTVLNNYGGTVYKLPHRLDEPAVLGSAVVVELGRTDHPAQSGPTVLFRQER